MKFTEKHQFVFNILRIIIGIGCAIMLILLYHRIDTLSSAAIYAATWVTFLHICIGEYVFVRYLHANSPIQNAIDLMATIFLLAGILAFASPALWCALFGGLFALAVTKYLILARDTEDPIVKKYAREKVLWESPSVLGMTILAIVLDQLPPHSTAARLLQIGILAITILFAIWMIIIRNAYRHVKQHIP